MKTISKKGNNKSSETNNSKPFFNLSEKSGESSFFDQKNPSPFFSVQPKLTIGQPNDKYEQEADAIADQVVKNENSPLSMNSGTNTIQPKCSNCEEEAQAKFEIQKQGEEEELQMQPIEEQEEMLQMQSEEEEETLQTKKNNHQKTAASPTFESTLKAKNSTGQKLPKNIKQEMESGIGANFNSVRIHNDSNAISLSKDINAQAFTHGNDIYFNKGKYNPSSKSGKHLLAHELTHVVQQTGGNKAINKKQTEVSKQSGSNQILSLKRKKRVKRSAIKKTKKALAAQKRMWDDLNSFFSNAGRKLAGSGYDENISYVKADFTEGEKDGVSHSSPTMYVGSVYAEETDADVRKTKLASELFKIDKHRVKKGIIDDKDMGDSQVNDLIDKLDVTKKQELITKMKAQKYITDNKSMMEHIRKKMPSTQWTSGAVANADGGFQYQFDNVTIIVKPDVFNSSKVTSGAETEMTPVNPPTVNPVAYSWDAKGRIDKIDPIPTRHNFTYVVQTHYSSSSSPTDTSGYGVGTEADAEGENTHLRKHEGAHGEVFIKYMQDHLSEHPYPTFTGKLNDKKKAFKKVMKNYKNDVKNFFKVIDRAMKSSEKDVDCVGEISIKNYYKKKKKKSPVKCKSKKKKKKK